MKITVLVENNTRIDNYLLAEPALSLLIELEGRKFLFDTGYSDVFLKNAAEIHNHAMDLGHRNCYCEFKKKQIFIPRHMPLWGIPVMKENANRFGTKRGGPCI